MIVEQLRSLAGYNSWANTRLLDAAADLTAEERERDMRASFASLHGTLRHILWGERGWLYFWQENEFLPDLGPGDYPDFQILREAWIPHERAYGTYLNGLTQAELDAPRSVDGVTFTLGELIQHAVNHSTHHRGQIVLLLRQLGHEPPRTDYQDYLAEVREQPAASSPG